MPPIFKALASISAWILFIGGCITIGANVVMGTLAGEYFNLAKIPSVEMFLFAGLGAVLLILSVCAMKLRQTLE